MNSRRGSTSSVLVDESLSLLFCVAVLAHLLIRTLVEWWRGDVEVTFLDDARHEAEEECHNQCVDVRTIDIGVGHDDDLVVTQLVDVSLSVGFSVNAEADTDRLDDVHHRFSLEHAVPLHFLYVENLTPQWKDRLRIAVASLFG